MERRFLHLPEKLEVREADGGVTVSGYAAVFYRSDDEGTEFEVFPRIRERIMPGAFDRALADNHDVRALVNHDPSQLLGRTTAGTLQLSKNRRGLQYTISLPDTTAGRDVRESIRRGDMSGSSFAFRVTEEKWASSTDPNVDEVREIHDVELYDVGPVTYPAYEATTTGLRTEDVAECRTALDAWRRHKEAESLRDLAKYHEHLELELFLAE